MRGKLNVHVMSLIATFALVIWSVVFTDNFASVTNLLFGWVTTYAGWLYLLVVGALVFFCFLLAASKYGSIKLGADDAKPEYSTVSWLAMLFSAGMGVGLVFWGVSEPLSHFISPDGITGGTAEAADFAIQASFMHWGVHPWTIYGIFGLSIAYFGFRKGEKNLLSSALIPVFGRKVANGALGKTVDVLTVVISVAGIASTLGLSALQITSGLEYLGTGVHSTIMYQIIIIVIVTVIFMVSSLRGLDKGMQYISNFNMTMAFVLLIIAFFVGPTAAILNSLTNGIGDYLSGFIDQSFNMHAYGDNGWVVGWRVFYWAWWISWGPFVGCFIARISRGRTIREFVLGVLLVPTIFSCFWFAIFGGLGVSLGINGVLPLDYLQEIIGSPETALFIVLKQYPLGTILSVIAILLLFTFFITSADSGTFVLSMFSSDGNINPSNKRKVTWGLMISLLAIGLLLAGGLKAIQTVSIVFAFPFLFIMAIGAVSIVKSLMQNSDFVYDPEDDI